MYKKFFCSVSFFSEWNRRELGWGKMTKCDMGVQESSWKNTILQVVYFLNDPSFDILMVKFWFKLCAK